MTLPPAVEEVISFRRAARAVVRDPGLTRREKLVAVVDLAFKAREAELPEFARQAVRVEGSTIIYGRAASSSSSPVERACRRLVCRGRSRCPECERPLPTEETLDRWAAADLSAAIEAERREILP